MYIISWFWKPSLWPQRWKPAEQDIDSGKANKTGAPRPLQDIPSIPLPYPPAELASRRVFRISRTLAASHPSCSHQTLRTRPASNAMAPKCSHSPVFEGGEVRFRVVRTVGLSPSDAASCQEAVLGSAQRVRGIRILSSRVALSLSCSHSLLCLILRCNKFITHSVRKTTIAEKYCSRRHVYYREEA